MTTWYDTYKEAAKATPTWEELQKLGPREHIRFNERTKEFYRRDRFVDEFSWAVPNQKAIQRIKNFVRGRKVLEVGSGNGLWSRLLQQNGVHITPTDSFSSHGAEKARFDKQRLFTDVKDMKAIDAVEKHEASVLMICWPPYECSLAANALYNFKGDGLIFIGESKGGCTANDRFFDILDSEWILVESVGIPKWSGLDDNLTLWQRKVI